MQLAQGQKFVECALCETWVHELLANKMLEVVIHHHSLTLGISVIIPIQVVLTLLHSSDRKLSLYLSARAGEKPPI